MKIPKKIRAFGREYLVIHDDDITASYESHGLVSHDKEFIALRKRSLSFSEAKEASTFLHEIIHIIEENLNIAIDEDQVNLLAVALYTILVDNKLNFQPLESK